MKPSNIIRNRTEQTIHNLKFNYDKLNDLLYAYKENSSVYTNIIIGNFHLEFNKDNELVGIEILNATDILAEYNIPNKFLESIQKMNLKIVTNGNSMLIFLILSTTTETKSATITLNNLEIPIMKEIAKA